jgi:hypothetical protein
MTSPTLSKAIADPLESINTESKTMERIVDDRSTLRTPSPRLIARTIERQSTTSRRAQHLAILLPPIPPTPTDTDKESDYCYSPTTNISSIP